MSLNVTIGEKVLETLAEVPKLISVDGCMYPIRFNSVEELFDDLKQKGKLSNSCIEYLKNISDTFEQMECLYFLCDVDDRKGTNDFYTCYSDWNIYDKIKNATNI